MRVMNTLFSFFHRAGAVLVALTLGVALLPVPSPATEFQPFAWQSSVIATEAVNPQGVWSIRTFLSAFPRIQTYHRLAPILLGMGVYVGMGAKKAQAYQPIYDSVTKQLIGAKIEKGDMLSQIALDNLPSPIYGHTLQTLEQNLSTHILRPTADYIQEGEQVLFDHLRVLPGKVYDFAVSHYNPLADPKITAPHDSVAEFLNTTKHIPAPTDWASWVINHQTPIVEYTATALAIGALILLGYVLYKTYIQHQARIELKPDQLHWVHYDNRIGRMRIGAFHPSSRSWTVTYPTIEGIPQTFKLTEAQIQNILINPKDTQTFSGPTSRIPWDWSLMTKAKALVLRATAILSLLAISFFYLGPSLTQGFEKNKERRNITTYFNFGNTRTLYTGDLITMSLDGNSDESGKTTVRLIQNNRLPSGTTLGILQLEVPIEKNRVQFSLPTPATFDELTINFNNPKTTIRKVIFSPKDSVNVGGTTPLQWKYWERIPKNTTPSVRRSV